MNPDDKCGLEQALLLKDKFGAHVTVCRSTVLKHSLFFAFGKNIVLMMIFYSAHHHGSYLYLYNLIKVICFHHRVFSCVFGKNRISFKGYWSYCMVYSVYMVIAPLSSAVKVAISVVMVDAKSENQTYIEDRKSVV